nr:hypothetical protein [Tanacetum cinerariifolium]
GFSDTIMSDSEDSTVTYTTVSSPYEGRSGDVSPGVDGPPAPLSPIYIPYVPEPVHPEYIPPEDDVFPAEEQPLPAAASPTADSPGYILESDPDKDPKDDDEDPKENPADYPNDHDDEEKEEKPSGNDADEENEEISFKPQPPTLFFTKEEAERFLAMPIPPPSPLTLLSSSLPQIPSPLLPTSPHILPIPLPTPSPPLQLLSFDRRVKRPEVTLPPRKRLSIVYCPGYEAGESSVAAVARPIEEDIGYGIRDNWIDPRDVAEEDTQGRQMEIIQRVEALVDDSQYHYETGRLVDQEARFSREAWAYSMGLGSAVHFELQGYMTHTWVQDRRIDAHDTLIATLTTQLSSLQGHLATALGEIRARQAREQARAGAPKGAGSSTKKMAPKKAAPKRTTRLNPVALTWWNSYVRIVGNDAAYVMTWIELKKKMADKQAASKRKFEDTSRKTKADNSLLKGKMWQGHTLQDLVIGNSMQGLDLCAPNAISTMTVHVFQDATSATRLATYLVTVGARQMPMLPTIRGVMGRVRKLLVMSAGHKETSKGIVQN